MGSPMDEKIFVDVALGGRVVVGVLSDGEYYVKLSHASEGMDMSSARAARKKPRGNITGRSNASRKRLIEALVRHRRFFNLPLAFFTLTYGKYAPSDLDECRLHFRTWLRRVRDRYPEFVGFWVNEYQKRGALHWHIVAIVVSIDIQKYMAEQWIRISGKCGNSYKHRLKYGFDMRVIEDNGGGALQKYLAKVMVLEPSKWSQQKMEIKRGRNWGYINRKKLKEYEDELTEKKLDENEIEFIRVLIESYIRNGIRNGKIKTVESVDENGVVSEIAPVRLWSVGELACKIVEIIDLK